MRVITGKARGRKLKTGGRKGTRPTQAATRDVLFNILRPDLRNARVLDLYAGYGIVGIEALSEGASFTIFVERSRACCQVIHENLGIVGLESQAEVLCEDALRALRRLASGELEFDLIFADPPYQPGVAHRLLEWLGEHPQLLAANGVLILQHFFKHGLNPSYGSLERRRERRVGDTQLSFFGHSAGGAGSTAG